MTTGRGERGVVLLIVLFFTLLLVASIATFTKRATVDAILSRNRDAMVRCEALARGGVELAKALLIADRISEAGNPAGTRFDSGLDAWAQSKNVEIPAAAGARLRLRIEDAGGRLNLNALFSFRPDTEMPAQTEIFLHAFLKKMIEELPIDVQALYDPRELAENLIDYVDLDQERISGGSEDDYYQQQTPPYRAANRPLLSVDELGLVEGFDAALVEIIRPYVTVHPFAAGAGVNPNTAPAHVLALIFYNDGVEPRLAKEEDVRRILEIRANDQFLCPTLIDEQCLPVGEIFPNPESIYPPLTFFSDTFTVRSEATVGDVQRTVETVIDRSKPATPVLLSWKVR